MESNSKIHELVSFVKSENLPHLIFEVEGMIAPFPPINLPFV